MHSSRGFLAQMNPEATLVLEAPTKKQARVMLLFDFRSTLAEQPPLGKNERLPSFLALGENEPAISFSKRPNFSHLPLLNLYIPTRHRLVADLAEQELAYQQIPLAHGTLDAIRRGCSGPVCRRLQRESRAESAHLRKARNRSQQIRTERQRNAAPQYAAVEPLLMAYTILSHYLSPAPNPSRLSKTLKTCNLRTYIRETYPTLTVD